MRQKSIVYALIKLIGVGFAIKRTLEPKLSNGQ
jgi:hypothetical protein